MGTVDRFEGEQRFLSNFYPAKVWHDGVSYPTVEHAFQAAKTLDFVERRRISTLRTPGQAKRAGKMRRIRPEWDQVKRSIMFELVLQKFSYHVDLRHQLLSTGELTLIEGNTWHDNFWGNCTCPACVEIPGQNHLGKALMTVRELLMRKR